MKKLFFFSASVLMLSIAALIGSHLWQGRAYAQSSVQILSAASTQTGLTYAYLSNGEFWSYSGGGWVQESPLPAPAAIVVSGLQFIDTNGNGWVYSNNQWYNYGPPPVGPTIIQDTTWGAIKKEHHEN